MMLGKVGYALSGLVGSAIIFIGGRFLFDPETAAAGYGLTIEPDGQAENPYLAVKGVRDIATGVITFALIATGEPRILARYLVAATIIPVGDAAIVLFHDGPRKTAYGVHASTAAVMILTAACLLQGPE